MCIFSACSFGWWLTKPFPEAQLFVIWREYVYIVSGTVIFRQALIYPNSLVISLIDLFVLLQIISLPDRSASNKPQ
jgi:hypothetical protein